MSDAFVRAFSTCFSLLGLKLLFGSKAVTMGSVVLLAAVSTAMASAWTGGGAAMFEEIVTTQHNASTYFARVVGDSHPFVHATLCYSGAFSESWCRESDVEQHEL